MKRFIFPASLLLTACLLVGCSENPAGHHSEAVSVQVADKGISVVNNLDTSVYYFAVESELATRINWAAVSTTENEIKAGAKKLVSFSGLGIFEKGKQIILYHWSAEDPTSGDIQALVISTGN